MCTSFLPSQLFLILLVNEMKQDAGVCAIVRISGCTHECKLLVSRIIYIFRFVFISYTNIICYSIHSFQWQAFQSLVEQIVHVST